MKRLLMCFLMWAVALSGCAYQSTQNENAGQVISASENYDFRFKYDEPLTLDEVKSGFEYFGLTLVETQDSDLQKYALDSVSPKIYSIKDSNQIVYVYIFDNIAVRQQVAWEWADQISMLPTPVATFSNGYYPNVYSVRNALIVHLLDLSKVVNIPANEIQVHKNIGYIVNYLNNSQRIVFMDKSANWDAQYLEEYYQHWYQDAAGVAHIDQSSEGKWSVKYIGPNPETIHNIKYSYKTPGRAGHGDGIFEKDGDYYFLRIHAAGGNDGYPVENGAYTLTITWNGQEETLELNPIMY